MNQKREPADPADEPTTTETPLSQSAHHSPNEADAGLDDLARLKAEFEQVQAEAKGQLEKFLRAKAEAENTRRRAETDVANAHKFAIERFAVELLAVRDSLELARAVDLKEENRSALEKMHEGLDLTLKLMDDVFKKFAIETVDPEGEKFDPHKHHAISLVDSDKVAPNHVVNVVQKGYLLHERVLRPAMVVVAQAKAAGAGDPDSGETDKNA